MAEPPSSTPVDEYRGAAASIRENAKWGMKSLGGVAAALIAGLGLSSLAKVHSSFYLALAIFGMAVALGGVGWLYYMTWEVLKPSTVSIGSVVAADKGLGPKYLLPMLSSKQTLLNGLATSIEQLQTDAIDAEAAYSKALLENYKTHTAKSKQLAEAEESRSELYEQTVRAIEAQAAYLEIVDRVHTFRQMIAGAVVAIGVAIFAVALALPTDPSPDFHGANLTGTDLAGTRLVGSNFDGLMLKSVDLSQADLRKANFDGAHLSEVSLLGADVKEASFKGTRWLKTICPDGANSDHAGNTCEQHLEVRADAAAPTAAAQP